MPEILEGTPSELATICKSCSNRVMPYADEFDGFDSSGQWAPPGNVSADGGSAELSPVEIPMARLRDDVLDALVDAFVLREGTDYGMVEAAHETKREQVRRQIEKGHAKIIFDPNTESVTVMSAAEWKKFAL